MGDIAYAVTSGEYSNYSVVAVFTDKALFDAYVAQCRAVGHEPSTEELPLNPNPDEIRDGVPTWYVKMEWDGNAADCGPALPPSLSEYEELPDWMPAFGQWAMWIVARDRDHAIKAVNERRLIAIANGTPRDAKAYYAWMYARRADEKENA